jgi:hypothetical protein
MNVYSQKSYSVSTSPFFLHQRAFCHCVFSCTTTIYYLLAYALTLHLARALGEIALNQVFLFGAAILMAIPIFMIFLSPALPAKVNRRVNIIAGIVYVGILVPAMLVPGKTWAYYIFYEILEAVFIALIVWHAWKWPKQEG